MAETVQVQTGLPYADILERQGLDPNLGTNDVTFEWAEFGGVNYPDYTRKGDWFAIPKEIVAVNPYTKEKETGRLLATGAFIADTVNLGDRLHPSKFGARAMVLGQSAVKDFCKIGDGTIINSSRIFNAKIGKNVRVDENTDIFGGNPFPKPVIGDEVQIGKDSYISSKTTIGKRVKIGDNVHITNAIIDQDVTIQSGDKTKPGPHEDPYRGDKTFVGRSRLDWKVDVGTNATIENSIVEQGTIIGGASIIENTHVGDYERHDAGTIKRELREAGNGRYEVEKREREEALVPPPAATVTIRSGMPQRPKLSWFGRHKGNI